MSRTSIAHAEVLAAYGRVHWLVEVELGGYVYRLSDEDVTVTDANGRDWRYVSGLGTLTVRVQASGDTSVSLSIAPDAQGAADGWPATMVSAVASAPPHGSPATVRRWVEGQALEEARVLMAGEVFDAEYDDEDAPLDLSIRWLAKTPSPIPPLQAEISTETWPISASYQPDQDRLGAVYPLIIGTPGLRTGVGWGGGTKTAYTTPAYMGQYNDPTVTYAGCRLILGWVPDGSSYHATTVTVWRDHDDTTISRSRNYAAQAVTVSTVQDNLGHTVSTVTPGAYTGETTTVKFNPGAEFWVRWDNGGGVYSEDRSGPMRQAGEVIAALLRWAGLDVDEGRMAAARGRLDSYLLDFAITDRVEDVRAFIEREIGAIIPLCRRTGGDGIWYEALNYWPKPSDAVLHLVVPERDREAAGYVETIPALGAPLVLVGRAATIAYTDDDVANTVTVRYAPDQGTKPTHEVVVTGGVPDSDRNEIGSVVCAASRARFGPRVGPVIETRLVHDEATAQRVALIAATRMAYPRRITAYVGDVSELEVVEVGDVIRITDRERGIDGVLALAMAVTYSLSAIEVSVEILDYLTHIGPVSPEEESIGDAFPGAEILVDAYHVTASSGTISAVRNLASSDNYTAVTGTAPTWSSSYAAFGGRPAIVCSGGSIATTATFGSDTDLTFVVALYDPSVTGSWESPAGVGSYSNNISFFRDNATDPSEWTMGVVEPGAPYGQVITATDGAVHVLVFVRRGSTHEVWVDGALAASKTGNTTSTTAGTATIGAAPTSGNFGGAIAFVGYWPRALSSIEVPALSNRLWQGALGQPGEIP